MGKTKVEWATHSWSPVTGCTKVSPGCKNCYAERMARRLAGRFGYPEAPDHFDVTLHPDRLEQPLRWRKSRQVFVCSMGDLFHKDVPFEFIRAVFNIMETAHGHAFQMLTKRPHRMLEFATRERFSIRGYMAPLPNIWLGVSVENQATANERIPLLLQIPAAVRFVNLEPLLGPVDLSAWLPHSHRCQSCGYVGFDFDHSTEDPICPSCGEGYVVAFANSCDDPVLDWTIVGGESGPGARPMHPQWARDIRDQCQAAGVPFFYKQNGEWLGVDQIDHLLTSGQTWADIDMKTPKEFIFEDGTICVRIGKKRAGRLLDGVLWEEYPE